jgi:acetyl esterase/lipase
MQMRLLILLACAMLVTSLLCAEALLAAAPATKPVETVATSLPYRDDASLDDYARAMCTLDFSYPTDRTGFATVVWFHAGGLTGGERAIPEALRGRGFAVAAAGYRLNPHVKSPAYIDDAAAAVAWTMKHIELYGGDPKRIFVAGHSAGGYLALMVGLDGRWLSKHGVDANDLAGIASLSGQAITHFTVRAERGVRGERPVIDDLAPLFHVRADASPVLLVTGDRDLEMLGRYEENAYLWRMLKVAGHERNELHELQGFDHGGMVDPGLPLVARFVERTGREPATQPSTQSAR